jgi:dsDNA-binding SOS-regulon protein
MDKLRGPDEMTKKELEKYNEMLKLSLTYQDIQSNHPWAKEAEVEREEEMKILEPVKKEVIAKFERTQNKKAKQMIKDMCNEAQAEGFMNLERL